MLLLDPYWGGLTVTFETQLRTPHYLQRSSIVAKPQNCMSLTSKLHFLRGVQFKDSLLITTITIILKYNYPRIAKKMKLIFYCWGIFIKYDQFYIASGGNVAQPPIAFKKFIEFLKC